MRTLGLEARIRGKKVLVTGSSGFIGTHLCRRLQAAGAEVIGLDLKKPREDIQGVTHIVGDVRECSGIAMPAVTAIFNCAAVHTTPGHPDHEYYDTNVLGALEVVKLAVRDAVTDVFFTSSISVYGVASDQKTENSSPAPSSAYGKSKWIAEEIHRNWLAGHPNARLRIVRPAVVFGAGEGGNFARIAALLRMGIFVFPGRRDAVKSCIYVEDLIDLMFAAGATNTHYELFNGSYPECPTLETIVTTIRDAHFPAAKFYDIPRPFVVGVAKLLSLFNGFGIGIHPDRVDKLVNSTNVYPQWVVSHGLAENMSLANGISRWAATTGGTFI